MEFKFKPLDDKRSYREYLDYLYIVSYNMNLIKHSIIIGILSLVIVVYGILFSLNHQFTKDTFLFFCLAFILILIIVYLIVRYKKPRKKSFLKYSRLFKDLDSTFYYSINDTFLTRTNEYSTIKIKLDSVKTIIILKSGLVLMADNMDIYISNKSIPISIVGFIALFKSENQEIIDNRKMELKEYRKIFMVCIIGFMLTGIIGYNIAKYNYYNNFETLNFITYTQLEKQTEDQTYLYNNRNFNIDIYFPEKWGAKYGIEELDESINVYYLPDEVQTQASTLLFKVVKGEVYDDNYTTYRFFKNENGEKLTFLTPKELSTFRWFYDEYVEMYNKLAFLKIE